MTDTWNGAIRQAAEQDGEAYCPYCLVESGTDADPLDEYGTTSVDADRADQDTHTLTDTLHVFGWVCPDHDTLCVRDPYEFDDPGESLVMVVLRGNTGESVTTLVPDDDLDDTTDDARDDPDPNPEWGDDYERVITITENNAPRSCFRWGTSARWSVLDPHKFTCGDCPR
jgi:hypothetical protein